MSSLLISAADQKNIENTMSPGKSAPVLLGILYHCLYWDFSEVTVSSEHNRWTEYCAQLCEWKSWLAELPGYFPDEVCAVLSSVPVSRNDLWCPVASTGGPHPSYSDSSSRVTELSAEADTYKLQLIFTPANSSMSPMSLNYSKLSCFNCGKMSWFSIKINPKSHVKRCQNNVL